MAGTANTNEDAKEPGQHEMGWLLHLATIFYCVTNFYYFPYFMWHVTRLPLVIRIIFLLGFLAGISGHFMEYRAYLADGRPIASFPNSPFRRGDMPLWSYVLKTALIMYVLALGPFLHVAYEFWCFMDERAGAAPMEPMQVVALFALGTALSIFGFTSIDRDTVVPSTCQWHTEHITLHGSMAVYMLGLGGVFTQYSTERYFAELWGLSALSVILVILVMRRDTDQKVKVHAE